MTGLAGGPDVLRRCSSSSRYSAGPESVKYNRAKHSVADFPAIAGVTLMLGVLYVAINTAGRPIAGSRHPRITVRRRLGCQTQPLHRGQPVLVVVDIHRAAQCPWTEVGIPHGPGTERVERPRSWLRRPAPPAVPVVFFQEVHRPRRVDFGRELDGTKVCTVSKASRAPSSSRRCGRCPRFSYRQAGAYSVSSDGISRSCCGGFGIGR